MSAPKPRLVTGASTDLLAGGVKSKGTPDYEVVIGTACWALARSGRHRLVVAYNCACGEEHVALAAGHTNELERRSPCGLDVIIRVVPNVGGGV